jgi:nucleotide-binding universal stress UspA family protein
MEKLLFVAVGDDDSALSGARFVGRFLDQKEHTKVALFYSAARSHKDWKDDDAYGPGIEVTASADTQVEQRGRQALAKAKEILVRNGFSPEHVQTIFSVRQLSKAGDIISQARAGLYVAAVFGKRDLSGVEEMFEDSVGKSILHAETDFPLWFCRRPDYDRSGVLLCVDGAAPSVRMADHVGFMLAAEKRHKVTLFHVQGKGGVAAEEKALNSARHALLDNGVEASRISIQVVAAGSIAEAVMKEAAAGQYAVVATGRTGKGKGLLSKFFLGSVSMELLDNLENAVLWVCR